MNYDTRTNNTANSLRNGLDIAMNDRVISYNVDEGERPGGFKVRFKIRVQDSWHGRSLTERYEAAGLVLSGVSRHSATCRHAEGRENKCNDIM